MSDIAQIPVYLVDAVDQALARLKAAAAEMRAAMARAAAGPGYDGQPPTADAGDTQGRMRRAPAIELMWKKQMITDGQFLAAQRYWMDVEMSTIAPLQVARYEAPAATDKSHVSGRSKAERNEQALSMTTPRGAKRTAGLHVPLSDLKLDALGRVNKVHDRILKGADREWSGCGEADRRQALAIVDMVAVKDFTILHVAAGKQYGGRNKVAKRLKQALEVMARHYGTQAGSGAGHIRSAHADDYRPEMDAPVAALAEAG